MFLFTMCWHFSCKRAFVMNTYVIHLTWH
jgi:hypothetical protein